MKNTISVFYANILSAADERGKSPAEVLAAVSAAGITAVDLDYEMIKNGLPAAIGEAGMKINSIYAFFDFTREDAFEEAKKVVDTAARYGAAVMFVAALIDEADARELKAETDGESIHAYLDRYSPAVSTAKALEALALYGQSRNVGVCVENFDSPRSLTERKHELGWLFRNAPHLGFNIDTGNSVTCREDIRELYTLFGDKTVNVHCKDRKKDENGVFPTAPVGAGQMPIREIKTGLINGGYTGGFSVEVFGVPDTLGAIISSAEYLTRE